MSLKIISYDLKGTNRDYDGLIAAIKEEKRWWHHLESFWLLDSEKSVESLTKKLVQFLDSDDRLVVFDLDSKEYNGFLPQKAFDWIEKHI
jgi:hypothetical protein